MAATKTLSLPEKFDFSYNKVFSKEYQAIFESPTGVNKIVLDFNRVNYLDSSALGMMVLLQKKAKVAKIDVAIVGAKSTAEEILKMANFAKLYRFE
jgi:anti-anti-sigma factor